MSQTIKVGKVELPVQDGTSKFVPHSGPFVDHGDMLETLAIGIRDKMPVILIGESGTGKTSGVRFLAQETKNGLRRVNLTGGTTADELVGRLLINDKGTYWVDGILTEAMRNGEWIVLDEINAALPEVLFVLQSILDDDGYLVLNEKDDKEVVYKHENFRLFATCNPPEYAGTKEMNKALLSRFGICITAEFPPMGLEKTIVEKHLGAAVGASEFTSKLLQMAKESRETKAAGKADYAINTRDVLNTLRLGEHREPQEAFALAFANKLDASDQKAIKAMAKLHLPTSKKKGSAQRTKVVSPEEMAVRSRYVLDQDTHNAYFGVTDDTKKIEAMTSANLGDIIADSTRDLGVKGDEFTVEAVFFTEADGATTDSSMTGVGEKAASIISFTAGSQKGKKAILIHHAELEDTIKVIDYLYEIE